MPAGTYVLTLPGPLLQQGFWLYVWRIEAPAGEYLYVGRTGDSASPRARSPDQRMGRHLGYQVEQNMLRQHLVKSGVEPEDCKVFHLIAHGPLFPQAEDMAAHRVPRDVVAAVEKALAEGLKNSGYRVLNTVRCRMPLDMELWAAVRIAFAGHFPKLIHE